MEPRTALAIGACLVCSACAPNLAFAPPPQKTIPAGPEAPLSRPLLRMSDPDADAFLVAEVARDNPGSPFRWTGEHSRFKLFPGPEDDEFYIRFGLIPANFRQTGPVTIGILVNGVALAARRFDAAGDYDYSHPVPPRLLTSASPVTVQLDISPVYIAPPWGERLGVAVQAVGFRRHQP